MPLLAAALERAGVNAPVTQALGRLISGELPLDEWVAVVRATVPPPARWRPAVRAGFWRRMRDRIRGWFTRSTQDDHGTFTRAEAAGVSLDPEPISKERKMPQIIRDVGSAG